MQVKQNFLVLQKRSLRKEFIICCCFLVGILITMHIFSKSFLDKDKLFLTLSLVVVVVLVLLKSLLFIRKITTKLFCVSCYLFTLFEAFSLCFHNNITTTIQSHENQEANSPKFLPSQFVYVCTNIFTASVSWKKVSLINRK